MPHTRTRVHVHLVADMVYMSGPAAIDIASARHCSAPCAALRDPLRIPRSGIRALERALVGSRKGKRVDGTQLISLSIDLPASGRGSDSRDRDRVAGPAGCAHSLLPFKYVVATQRWQLDCECTRTCSRALLIMNSLQLRLPRALRQRKSFMITRTDRNCLEAYA